MAQNNAPAFPTNPVRKVFDSASLGTKEEFIQSICASHAPLLCAAIRKVGDKKDIFCEKVLALIRERANEKT